MRQWFLAFASEDGYKAATGNNKDGKCFKDDALMLPFDLDHLTATQRLIVEQAFVMAQELEAVVEWSDVLDRCESFLLGNGRDFLRKVLESTLQTRAQVLEKKGAPPESAPVVRRDGTKAKHPRR